MTAACPACRTEYTVTPQDVGRRIACARCGTHLAVDETGLRAEEAGSAAPPAALQGAKTAAGTAALPGKRLTDNLTPLRGKADWPTVLFLAGVGLVLCFVLMPSIAAANVERRTARLGEAMLDHAAYIKKLREKGADPKQVAEAEEAWQARREELQNDVKYAEFARGRGAYWDKYGLLLGYLVLAAGAVGWTRPDQSLVRRVLGAVVLAVQLLLAFQTVTPAGCSPAGRTYNLPATPTP